MLCSLLELLQPGLQQSIRHKLTHRHRQAKMSFLRQEPPSRREKHKWRCNRLLWQYVLSYFTSHILPASIAYYFAVGNNCGGTRFVPPQGWMRDIILHSPRHISILLTREYAACGLFGYFPCHLASSLAPPKPKYTGKRALLWQEKTLPQSLMNATAHPLMVANTRQGIQMKRTWT